MKKNKVERDYKKIFENKNGHNGQEIVLGETDYLEEIINKNKIESETKGYISTIRF